jgi:AbrB family looped-hinge helix DNA binding protein
MARSTLTSKGQTTIPKGVRDELRLVAGDRIDFFAEGGRLVGVPAKITLDQLMKILPKPTKHVSLEDMDAGIRAEAARRSRQVR